MNNVTEINTIVKICSVKITAIASKFKDTCINWLNIFIFLFRHKPPFSTNVFEFVNIPISCIDTTDLYDVGESNSHSLRDIAKCSTLAYENIPLLESWVMKIQIIHMCQETLRHLDIWLPLLFWTNASSSTDVDAPKFWLVQYDILYGGEKQDASDCLMMLVELINKGSVPYCGSNDNNSTGVTLSEILFSFMLENILSAMHVGWDPWHSSLVACYILLLLVPLSCMNR